MKKLKLILLTTFVIIILLLTYRVYKIQTYTKYNMNSNTLIISTETYELIQDNSILVTNEGNLLGIAIDGKLKLSDYFFPHYVKMVETTTGEKCVLVSSGMWDGLFRKSK